MSGILQAESYRDYLSWVLAERIVKNRRYSLRAFAKCLGLSAAHLSCLLKGKRHLSADKALEVAQKLKLDEQETFYFMELVQSESARSELTRTFLKHKRERAPEEEIEVVQAREQEFEILATWYLVPILAMCDIAETDLTAAIVGARLGLTKEEATQALSYLARVGLLRKLDDGAFRRSSENLLFKSKTTHQKLRHFHRAMLSRTIQSLYQQSPDERISRTETMAIDTAKLPEAKELVSRFMRDLVKLTTSGKKRSEVYHFSLHGFRLTKKERGVEA